MTRFLNFEKVELMGRSVQNHEISRYIGTGRMSFWMPVVVMNNGKVYTAMDVSTKLDHIEAMKLAAENDYTGFDYFIIPRKYTEFFEGSAYYFNPALP